jgi:hypothetical protein
VAKQRAVARKKESERQTKILGGITAAILGVGMMAGVGKMWRDLQRWQIDQLREKPAWERAMSESDPKV